MPDVIYQRECDGDLVLSHNEIVRQRWNILAKANTSIYSISLQLKLEAIELEAIESRN